MNRIHIGGSHPDCPLCLKPFIKVPDKGHNFYVCLKCMVSINVLDPCIVKWSEYKPEVDEIHCPNPKCEHPMRFFFRSDKFFVAKCPNPKCATTVSTEVLPDSEDEWREYWGAMEEDK